MVTPQEPVFAPHPYAFRPEVGRFVLALFWVLVVTSCLLFSSPLGSLSRDERLHLQGDGVRMFQQRRFVKGIRAVDIGFDGNDRCNWVSVSVLSVGSRAVLRLDDPIWRATRLFGKPVVFDHDSLGVEYVYEIPPYRVTCSAPQGGRIRSLVLSR